MRRFQKGEAADPAKVLSLSKRYGELDGEMSYLYATAFANVAWCSTVDDKYPTGMRTTCLSKFTGRLLELLAPDVVILSGGAVGDHEAEIRRFAPKAHIIRTLHYAHREAGEVEAAAIANVRHAIGTLPRAL